MSRVKKVEVGDRVRMVTTHTGTIEDTGDGAFLLRTDDGKAVAGRWGPHLEVYGLRRPPKHWPPKPGEVWAAGDTAWIIGENDRARPTAGQTQWTTLASLDEIADDFHRVWPPEETDGTADRG